MRIGFSLLLLLAADLFAETTFTDTFDSAASLDNYQLVFEGSKRCNNPVVSNGKLQVRCQNDAGLQLKLNTFASLPQDTVRFEIGVTVNRWGDSGPTLGFLFNDTGKLFDKNGYLLGQTYVVNGSGKDNAEVGRFDGPTNSWKGVSVGPSFPKPGPAHTYRFVGEVSPSQVQLQIYEGAALLRSVNYAHAGTAERCQSQVSIMCREADCDFDNFSVSGIGTSTEVDSGLRYFDGHQTIALAGEPNLSLASLRIQKPTGTQGLKLVPLGAPGSTPLRISKGGAIYTVKKYEPSACTN